MYTVPSEDCISLFRTKLRMQELFNKFIYADTCVKLAKAHNVRIVLQHMNMLGTRGVQITENVQISETILFVYKAEHFPFIAQQIIIIFGGVG